MLFKKVSSRAMMMSNIWQFKPSFAYVLRSSITDAVSDEITLQRSTINCNDFAFIVTETSNLQNPVLVPTECLHASSSLPKKRLFSSGCNSTGNHFKTGNIKKEQWLSSDNS